MGLFLICQNGFSQMISNPDSLRHKISLGGYYFDKDDYLATAAFNSQLGKRSEMEYSFYYNGKREMSCGVAYRWAMLKKHHHFNIYLSPELFFYTQWNYRPDIQKYRIRYGPFLFFGIIPSYKISSRLSVSLDLKIGRGFLWVYHNEYYRYNGRQYSDGAGDFWGAIPALKLYYIFR